MPDSRWQVAGGRWQSAEFSKSKSSRKIRKMNGGVHEGGTLNEIYLANKKITKRMEDAITAVNTAVKN
jgi:hypothetical protein